MKFKKIVKDFLCENLNIILDKRKEMEEKKIKFEEEFNKCGKQKKGRPKMLP